MFYDQAKVVFLGHQIAVMHSALARSIKLYVDGKVEDSATVYWPSNIVPVLQAGIKEGDKIHTIEVYFKGVRFYLLTKLEIHIDGSKVESS